MNEHLRDTSTTDLLDLMEHDLRSGRWDGDAPIEETVERLRDAFRVIHAAYHFWSRSIDFDREAHHLDDQDAYEDAAKARRGELQRLTRLLADWSMKYPAMDIPMDPGISAEAAQGKLFT